MEHQLILALQAIKNPLLDAVAEVFRFIAEPEFSAILILILYWCIDKRLGKRLAIAVLSGSLLCNSIKNVFRVERPFLQNGAITPENVETATGYSFPSGHTQNGSTTAVTLALWSKRSWVVICAVLFGALVGFSRIYHGVHTGYDVLAGWILGAAWAFLCDRLLTLIEKNEDKWYRYLLLLPIVVNLIALLPFWSQRPAQPEDSVMLLGLYAGMLLGFGIERKFPALPTRGGIGITVLKILVGLLGAGVVFVVFSWIPSNQAVRILKYFIVALWATAGQPFCMYWLCAKKKGND